MRAKTYSYLIDDGSEDKKGGVGLAADRRISKFTCRKTQIFKKQCRMPQN